MKKVIISLLPLILFFINTTFCQLSLTSKFETTFGITSALRPAATVDFGLTTKSEYGNTVGVMLSAMPIAGLKAFPVGLYGSYRFNGYKGLMVLAGVEFVNELDIINNKRKYIAYPMVGIKVYSYKIIPLDLRISGNAIRLLIGFQIK